MTTDTTGATETRIKYLTTDEYLLETTAEKYVLMDQVSALAARVAELEAENARLREAIIPLMPHANVLDLYASILAEDGGKGIEPWAIEKWQRWLEVKDALTRGQEKT